MIHQKTENSVRTIDIPNFLKEEVQEYAKKYYGFPEDQRLFPIVARTLQKRLKKYEALTGVKPIRVHDYSAQSCGLSYLSRGRAIDYQGKAGAQRYSDDIEHLWASIPVTAEKSC